MVTHFSVLAGRSHGQRSLAGYSPWSHKESDTTEHPQRTPSMVPGVQYTVCPCHLFSDVRRKAAMGFLPGTSHLGETHRCQEDVMIKALTGSDGAFTLIRGDREDLLVRWRVGKNRRVKGILGGWHLWRPFQWVGPVSLAQRGNSGVF